MESTNSDINSFEKQVLERSGHGFEEQIEEAVNTIRQIENIDADAAYLTFLDRINYSTKGINGLMILSRIAAVLFIPLLIFSGLLINKLTKTDSPSFATHEITSPPGLRSKVILPDGTKIWLNSESTIQYSVPFDAGKREVKLWGEAYFDVHKDQNAPFTVNTGNLNVTVLGTKFNFKAFDNENNIEVVLEEGKVNLKAYNAKTLNEITLNPGDRAVFNKGNSHIQVTRESTGKYTAWHEGKLIFDETPMPEVAVELERWFGIEVVLQEQEIKNYKITTTFENESINQVLDLLELSSPITVEYVLPKIDQSGKEKAKSKIIISKKSKKGEPMRK